MGLYFPHFCLRALNFFVLGALYLEDLYLLEGCTLRFVKRGSLASATCRLPNAINAASKKLRNLTLEVYYL